MSEPQADIERYDLLIVSQNRNFNLVDQGTRAVVNFLASNNVMRPVDEAIASEWCEIYGKPGPDAHQAFIKGGFPGAIPPFLECAVRTGQRFVPLPYGGAEGDEVRFFIEFRGVLWKQLSPNFKNKLQRLLVTRIELLSRPHGALPAHLEVPDDELPEDRKFARQDRATPRVGTAVEEF